MYKPASAHSFKNFIFLNNDEHAKGLLFYVIVTIIGTFISILGLSFLTYGISYGVNHDNYNMTTGCPNENPHCFFHNQLMCYDEFNGCIVIGFISYMLLITLVLIGTIFYNFHKTNQYVPINLINSSGELNHDNV